MIYAEHPTCLSESATSFVGMRPTRGTAKGKVPSWLQGIQVKRYARASDGRVYALVHISGARPAKAWADVVTGTLYRATDGACWSSVKVLNLASLRTVDEREVRTWTATAQDRSKRQDWDRSEE